MGIMRGGKAFIGGDAEGIPIGGAIRSSMMGPWKVAVHMGLGENWLGIGDWPIPC
jgi:hypothetical protein